MNIAIVSKLWEPTTPESTGGTGVGVGYLAEELAKRGHNITLFASSDSTKKIKLISFISSNEFRKNYSEAIEYLNIAQAFDTNNKNKFDLIHCHTEHKSLFFGSISSIPSLHTIRYGEFFEHEKIIFNKYKKLNFISISKSIQKMLPKLNWIGNVYNGIDIKKYPLEEKKQNYLLFLGRLSSQKGPHIAIKIAKKLNMNLILAGKKSLQDKQYFENEVEPFIDNKQIKYIGEANFNKKIKILKNAICLLHPINYIEAFGFTLIESMACGTPVIAFRKGAISEIIEHKKTGFIVKNEKEMIEAVKNIQKILPKDCRQRVEKYFTVEKMTDGYEKIYNRFVAI